MHNNLSFGHYDRIIIHTPHAGTVLPIHFHVIKHQKAITHNNELKRLILPYYRVLTDHYTDKLFSFVAEGAGILRNGFMRSKIRQITFPYSRLFCDVERLENDPLEEKGLGIHYDFTMIARYDFNNYWEQQALLYERGDIGGNGWVLQATSGVARAVCSIAERISMRAKCMIPAALRSRCPNTIRT